MLYVSLSNISFVAYHGAFAEEQKLGNEFIVNIKVGAKDEKAFIDYADLLDIVKDKFSSRMDYLETLIAEIEKEIVKRIKPCDYLFISIRKKNPPLQAVVDSSEVILEKNY
jgi:dihydroneopterin aldolase